MEIIRNYYVLTVKEGALIDASKEALLDSSILQHVMEILCIIVKKSKEAILDVFPLLLEIAAKTEDTYLLLHSTGCLRSFLAVAS